MFYSAKHSTLQKQQQQYNIILVHIKSICSATATDFSCFFVSHTVVVFRVFVIDHSKLESHTTTKTTIWQAVNCTCTSRVDNKNAKTNSKKKHCAGRRQIKRVRAMMLFMAEWAGEVPLNSHGNYNNSHIRWQRPRPRQEEAHDFSIYNCTETAKSRASLAMKYF